MTVNELIFAALRALRVYGPNDTPTTQEYADALVLLNLLIDSWSLENLMLYQNTRFVGDLVAGTGSYTIGSGGDFDTTRPLEIETAGVIQDPSVTDTIETPITVLSSKDEYASIVTKATQATFPRFLWYNPSHPLGTVYVNPVPVTSTPDLVLYLRTLLTSFATGGTTVSVPNGYALALIYNLALLLGPEYDEDIPQFIVTQANKFKSAIETRNVGLNIPILTPDYPIVSTGFDIITGETE